MGNGNPTDPYNGISIPFTALGEPMYVFGAVLNLPFDAALERVREALAAERFGLVSDINVQGILQAKLGEDIGNYRILGACAAGFAKQIIEAQPAAGVLLPCQVVVRQLTPGATAVDFMDPVTVLGLADLPELAAVAASARRMLEGAKNRLTSD